jgi:glycosyltransferase involved in cell wall biosynthesis
MQMKVLHITNNYPTEKLPIFGIFVKEQIDSLSKIGVENEIFFINGREKGKKEYLNSIIKLRQLLKKRRFDVIHCHHVYSAICLILSGYSGKNRTVISYQNDPTNEQGNKVFKLIKRKFDAIIFKNNSALVDSKKLFYQPNGVNTEFFRSIDRKECLKKLGLDADKRYLLFVSSNLIRNQKRYDRFTEVLRLLREKYNLHDVEELKLINTERSLVPYYFNVSSLHLMTSDFEGSPNSVKEAMACNIPVISTDVGNVRELLWAVDGSFVADTKEVQELAELTYQALNDNLKVNSRDKLIEMKLDIDSVAYNIVLIYKKIIHE